MVTWVGFSLIVIPVAAVDGRFSALAWLITLVPILVAVGRSVAVRRHFGVTLDQYTLRVGGRAIRVADIDPFSVHEALAEPTPPLLRRLWLPSGEIERSPVFGKAARPPVGMDSVVVRTRSGRRLRIATVDRYGLLRALASVVPPS